MEEWREIKGYEGKYRISNCGRVLSLARTVKLNNGRTRFCRERILKIALTSVGYPAATLSTNGVNRTITLHRLVAKAFIPNPRMLNEVNHKDGNKENCHQSNLEWVTRSENRIHAYAMGLQRFSDETRRKLSISHMGHVVTEETRAKIRATNTGQKRSEETRKNISKAKSGANSPFYGKKPWIFGLHHSKETKEKISIASKAAWGKRKKASSDALSQ